MNAICWVGKPYKNIYREECRVGERKWIPKGPFMAKREGVTDRGVLSKYWLSDWLVWLLALGYYSVSE